MAKLTAAMSAEEIDAALQTEPQTVRVAFTVPPRTWKASSAAWPSSGWKKKIKDNR